jgi:hypothetical protein
MTKRGFRLRRLVVSGAGLHSAEIDFANGLNVITGPSNTGKSYVFRCIEYMLGGQSQPKEVTESAGYDTIALEIESVDGKSYTLRRSLKGGHTHLFDCRFSEIDDKTEVKETLQATPHKTKPSVSSFLMSLSGISPMQVRTNKNDDTENVSFRTLAHLFLVTETQILAEKSPIYSDVNTDNTKNESQFYAFITGVDDSSLIAKPKKAIVDARIEGKEQLYEDLIAQAHVEIDKITNSYELPDVQTIDEATGEINDSIELIGQEMDASIAERKRLSDEISAVDSRIFTIDELLFRFNVLEQHYQSDLKRLDFISEGENLVAQLQVAVCDSCGRILADGKHSHSEMQQPIAIQDACRAEAAKIKNHISDLANTCASLSNDRVELMSERDGLRLKVHSTDKVLSEHLKPLLSVEQKRLRNWLDIRRDYDRLDFLRQSLNTYVVEKAALTKKNRQERKKGPETSSDVDTTTAERAETRQGALRKLCDGVSTLLDRWEYSKSPSVSFDTSELDLIIDGVPRINNGKGIRALLYSAFTLGILAYARLVGRSHPGIIVMDSPLTTLKEANDKNKVDAEEVPDVVQQAFFADLATFSDSQIILMENKVPAQTLWSSINLVQFTKNRTEGRYGFFPLKQGRG